MKKNKQSEIYKQVQSRLVRDKEGKKRISYSQYSVYAQCPHRWNLTYVQGLYPFTSNMNTVFGTAIHEVLQNYLTLLYTISGKSADDFDSEKFFEERLKSLYIEEVKKNSGNHFSSPDEITEFYEDGISIIKFFKRKRRLYFDSKHCELLGCEIPILHKMEELPIYFDGYLDVVLYDHFLNKVIIIDFKTSKSGWRDKEKKDELKISQIILYKKFFSEQYGIDIEKVEVQFMILKRKVPEFSEWPIPRMSKFIPASGTVTVNKILNKVYDFVKNCFDDDGNYAEKYYPKKPSMDACRWCPFNENFELCSKRN